MIAESVQGDLADIEGTYFTTGGHFWVAVVGDEIVGMIALESRGKRDGELRRMSVKAEYRRCGVGRRLVQHLKAWASQRGFARVWLAVGPVFVEACFEKRLTGNTELVVA